jgi:hypothetical protein
MSQKYIRGVINSSQRLIASDLSTNFTFSFNQGVERVSQIIIERVEIPFSYFVITSNNNILTLNNGAISITIPVGNYTSASICTELDALLLAQFPSANPNVEFSNQTFRLSITMSQPFIVDSITSNPASTVSVMLGFSITTPSSTTATGSSALNISGPNYIIISSTYFSNFIDTSMLFSNNLYSNAIYAVPVEVSPGDLIIEHPNYPIQLSTKYPILNTDIIDIQLYDDSGNLLNLNGLDWALQVIFVVGN